LGGVRHIRRPIAEVHKLAISILKKSQHIKGESEKMGKRNLFMGMLLGAIIGGLASLFNKETRAYTKGKVASCKAKTGNMIKNPSETVRNTRVAFDQLNERFTDNAANVINALEQVENTLDKVSGKSEQDALPLDK